MLHPPKIDKIYLQSFKLRVMGSKHVECTCYRTLFAACARGYGLEIFLILNLSCGPTRKKAIYAQIFNISLITIPTDLASIAPRVLEESFAIVTFFPHTNSPQKHIFPLIFPKTFLVLRLHLYAIHIPPLFSP